MATRPAAIWYALVVAWLSLFLLFLISVVQARQAVAENARQWCSLLSTLAAPEEPPTTDRSRQIYRDVQELRHTFHCPGA